MIYSIVNHASNIKFTYRTDHETDLLFQVNKNNKMRNADQKQCWSKMLDLSLKLDRKEESNPSCSSSRRNSLAAVVAAPFGIHSSY
jgi:type IV pilus biogenesis protein CpaD/CtpE